MLTLEEVGDVSHIAVSSSAPLTVLEALGKPK